MKHCLLLSLFLFPTLAKAEAFKVGVGTEFPLGWNIQAQYSLPTTPIYLRAGVGGFLTPYTRAMNSVAESMEFYDSSVSTLVEESLNGALSAELALGYEQAPIKGWTFELAYNYSSGQGEVTGNQLAAAVTGISILAATNTYQISAEVHSVVAKGGYKWLVSEGWILWGTLGLLKPFESTTTIDRPTTTAIQQAFLQRANEQLDAYMKDIFKNDVYIPFVGLHLLYSF